MRLPEHWHEDVARIARMSASRFRGGGMFTRAERVDLAGGGIIEHIAEHGWPADEKILFRAADNGIRREQREQGKHQMRGVYWLEPRGTADPIGETVTDRLAVWQIVWALTDGQWAAVWAWAEVMKRDGTHEDAAALLDLGLNAFRLQLSLARKRARALWVAPGDTPPRHWAHDKLAIRSAGYRHRARTQIRARAATRARRAA